MKKGTPYVSAIKVIFDMSAINIHCPLQEENVIMEGISEVNTVLDSIEFTPKGVTITLFSLIINAIVCIVFIIVILYLACVPGALIKCKSCCCKASES